MQEKSLIKKNILYYLDINSITKYKFYQETGITRGILDQNNGISEENITKFLAYYKDVNPEWLITGNGSMIKNNNIVEDPEAVYKVSKIPKEDASSLNYTIAAQKETIELQRELISILKKKLALYEEDAQCAEVADAV
jgi:hypothetical protein